VKYIKIVGLAAVAAMAIMAFVGAASASATQLCATTGTGAECAGSGAGKFEYEGAVTGTSTNATLATNLANVVCEHSETTLNAEASTGSPVITGTVSALSFTGCKTEGTNIACTVTVRNLPYHSELSGTTLTVTDPSGAGAKVVCGLVLSCEFLTPEANLAVVNGSPTVAKAEGVELEHEAGLTCPATAEWNATYAVTAPTGLTVL